MLAKEWFTAAELAALRLPGLAAAEKNVLATAEREDWCRPKWEGRRWRARAASGGGYEYHYSVLPPEPQTALVLRLGQVDPAAERATAKAQRSREEMWAWFEALPEKKRLEAQRRLTALDKVEDLRRVGVPKVVAAMQVASQADVALSGLYRWEAEVRGVERVDWLPHLASRHAGGPAQSSFSPEAWEFLKADWLRPERPNLSDCYRRLQDVAAQKGWTIPSEKTFSRRLDALPEQVRVLAREGAEALKRLFPAQVRDRGVFHALEAVNADGHRWDVFVRWPDGTIGRPVMVAFQDLYSGMVLSWRVERTESTEAVRLAFGDLVERWGIPEHCWFDNGRNFTAKELTGGTPNRFRFKVRDDEVAGILTQLGVAVHFTAPYSGQSKPIERAFRDFATGLAKHPSFAGAYVGNSPMAKPENYGSKAVALDAFMKVVGAGIVAHNERVGRASKVCRGELSFQQAFDASYVEAAERGLIRKASAQQRRLWLLSARTVPVNRKDGTFLIEGNRYWSDRLLPLRGQKVVVRFDPLALHEDQHVYRTDGAYLCMAECQLAVGFNSIAAAREFGRKRRTWIRGARDKANAELSLGIDEAARMLDELDAAEPAPVPETRIVRLVTGANALQPRHELRDEEEADDISGFIRSLEMQSQQRGGSHLSLVAEEEDGEA